MTERTVQVQAGYRVHAWGEPPLWEQFPAPVAGRDEVLIDVEACGIGLTVLNCIAGDLADDPALLPRVPGHELVGRVVGAGPGAGAELVGRRVAAYFYLTCGRCRECASGQDSRCERLAGWVGVHRDGGYAPRAVLPAHQAIPLPESLDPVAATVVPDAVATPLHVCGTRAQVGPRDRVAVIGAGGGVGMHLLQVARLYGAEVAGLEVQPKKLAAIDELGAPAIDASDLERLDPCAIWQRGPASGRPPTVAVDLVGAAATLAWSARALTTGGRLVVLTTFRDRTMALDPRAMVFRETSVIGSRYATRSEVRLAGDLVASGRVRPVIGEVVKPDGVPDVHDRLRGGTLLGRAALRWP